ncbi:hypothetical protein [Abyssogena phaseoliformis symbiont]|uniref:hypothetical protein n=1 Tax=Abyssogena phaseoliformis symbiont TaxID=596095 RepID=UPI00191530D1|nr:hypothetical protein [Abyssogena phaseoliformis symbiont]
MSLMPMKRSSKKGIKGIDSFCILKTMSSTPSANLASLFKIKAIQSVFDNAIPLLSSTKSLTGHSIGASGVHELIHCLLMIQNSFVFGNHEYELNDEFNDVPILKHNQDMEINTVISNSFGFGGTNASLIFKKYD